MSIGLAPTAAAPPVAAPAGLESSLARLRSALDADERASLRRFDADDGVLDEVELALGPPLPSGTVGEPDLVLWRVQSKQHERISQRNTEQQLEHTHPAC